MDELACINYFTPLILRVNIRKLAAYSDTWIKSIGIGFHEHTVGEFLCGHIPELRSE